MPWTKTTAFMLPCFGKTAYQYGVKINNKNNCLINTYLGVKGRKMTPHIYLLYTFKTVVEYDFIIKKLQKLDWYDSREEIDMEHTLVKMEIPDRYKLDYDKFLEGKYSEFSNKLKHNIRTFEHAEVSTEASAIVNKSIIYRRGLGLFLNTSLPMNAELCSAPILEEEKLDKQRVYETDKI
jgi:hypothetical protein